MGREGRLFPAAPRDMVLADSAELMMAVGRVGQMGQAGQVGQPSFAKASAGEPCVALAKQGQPGRQAPAGASPPCASEVAKLVKQAKQVKHVKQLKHAKHGVRCTIPGTEMGRQIAPVCAGCTGAGAGLNPSTYTSTPTATGTVGTRGTGGTAGTSGTADP
jgi:hypothetical protein